MAQVKCPYCDATLPAQEIANGWCENCGKKIPRFALEGSKTPGWVEVHTRHHTASTATKPTAATYAILFAFITLGAIAVMALDHGRANWVWIGCGIGAGLGAWVAQTAGYWPRKVA